MSKALHVLLVAGARPNFVKVAPLWRAFRAAGPDAVSCTLVHTGQHRDAALSDVFFRDLDLPDPHVRLEMPPGLSMVGQTAFVLTAFERELLRHAPDVVVVVGDVTSTLACALTAARLGVRLAHVEAGLRSGDRTMPEELNRVATDQLADLLFTTEIQANENLAREGIAADRVHFVGNVMVDSLLAVRGRAAARAPWRAFGLLPRGYTLLTLHRPSNVDRPETFERVLDAIEPVLADAPVIFPVHPRTRPRLDHSTPARALQASGRLVVTEPLGYLDFVGLLDASAAVLTDSGGVQEESSALGIPCLTLRETTERPVTVTHGTNQVTGTGKAAVREAWRRVRAGGVSSGVIPKWDGLAAARIAETLLRTEAQPFHGDTAGTRLVSPINEGV